MNNVPRRTHSFPRFLLLFYDWFGRLFEHITSVKIVLDFFLPADMVIDKKNHGFSHLLPPDESRYVKYFRIYVPDSHN